MSQDNTKLIQYIGEEFQKVHTRMDGLSQQFNGLQTVVDNYAKRAEKTGVKLED